MFCFALLLVMLAARSVEVAEKRSWLAQQQARAHDIASSLERKAASDAAYLVTMASLFANVGAPSPPTFSAYVGRLRLIENMSGVEGVGWIDEVNESDLPALRARLGDDVFQRLPFPGAHAQRTWPAQVVTMGEPSRDGMQHFVGTDLQRDPNLRTAMDAAKRSGAVSASSTTGSGPSVRFFVFAPVRTPASDGRFLGFTFLPVQPAAFVRSAVPVRLLAEGRIDLVETSRGGEHIIYSSHSAPLDAGIILRERMEIFDRTWTLLYAPPPRQGFYPFSLAVLIGGAAFSALLLAYVLLVQRRSADLQALLDAQIGHEKERAAFIREVNHRVKNTLANVTSMIALSRNRTDDVQHFADTLQQRVKALACSHALLDGHEWGPTGLRAIITTQLSGYGACSRIDVDGPEVMISPNDALTIGLAIHELATNAARFGALSSDEGRVSVHWRITDETWVEVDWREAGGPPVTQPSDLGLGLKLVQRALAHELRRPIEIGFDPEGLHCHFFVQRRVPKSFQLRS